MQIEKSKIDEDEFMRRVAGELPRRRTNTETEQAAAEKPITEPSEHENQLVSATKAKKASGMSNNAEDRYRMKYLKPIANGTASKRFDVRLSGDLHVRLKRICNLVFDGQISMAALITNVMNEHIDNHRELYDMIYQKPKSWNA